MNPDPKAVAEAAVRFRADNYHCNAQGYTVLFGDLMTLAAAYVSGPPAAVREAAERVATSFDEPFYGPDVMLVMNWVRALPGRKEVAG